MRNGIRFAELEPGNRFARVLRYQLFLIYWTAGASKSKSNSLLETEIRKQKRFRGISKSNSLWETEN